MHGYMDGGLRAAETATVQVWIFMFTHLIHSPEEWGGGGQQTTKVNY